MPPSPNRGSVWIADLGMAAKVRPFLILSISPQPHDRALVTVVPHTTSIQATDFEVAVQAPFLKAEVFDAQQVITVSRARLVKRLGDLTIVELAEVEEAVRKWLNL